MAGMMHPEIPEKLSKLCDSKQLNYLEAGKCCSDVTLSLIIDSFNDLESLYIESPDYRSNWMQDMLSFKNLKLKTLSIQSQFKKLFCFEPEELSQLYKNLPPEFVLTLKCDTPPENASELVRQKLGPHFKEINNESRNTGGYGGYLYINLGDYLYFQIREQTLL
uniref:FTH domain-containing protein n=1 Tax=Panagrellus redivivus TaxID=6233 RepID=A0A7E4VPX8_PANRE